MPGGKLFAAKNITNSNLRKLLTGLSFTLFDTNGFIKDFTDDISPLVTRKFLAEWESAVQLPDDCFIEDVNTLTLLQRRTNIIAKLSYMAVQTGTSIEELLDWIGFTGMSVYPGIDDPTGVTTGLSDKDKRFTIVVDTSLSDANVFPFTFPFTFGDSSLVLLQCIMEKVKPSNCQVLFNYV